MIKLLSLFSGIGAFEKALENNNINYELVNFCEIDNYASKCYVKIHNEDINKNLGDITKVNIEALPKNIDILTHGSPCQDFSISGKNKGGDENSGTRSSLLWYSVKIISHVMPKYIIWENVKNVLSPKHIHNFEKYLAVLEALGYKNQYKVFNSKNFGLAQNRERIFVVSIRNDIKCEFDINKVYSQKPKTILDDILLPQESIEDKYYCKRPLKRDKSSNKESDIVSVGQVSTKNSQAGKVYNSSGIFPTICAGTHGYSFGYVYQNEKVRMLTPLETFLLMGFSKEDFEKCKNINISDTQLYKMAGNSITVPILEEIFKILL